MPTLHPPSANTGTYGHRGLWRFYTFPEGLALVKIDGTWTIENCVNVDIADEFYLGGYEHMISDAKAAELFAAGFGEYITYGDGGPADELGYGDGAYGSGAYGD